MVSWAHHFVIYSQIAYTIKTEGMMPCPEYHKRGKFCTLGTLTFYANLIKICSSSIHADDIKALFGLKISIYFIWKVHT